MSVLQKLTEGIQSRNLRQEGDALLEKWERTGLLEGMDSEHKRQGMARLLENQAAQLLKEASTMAGGDVEGFASVAFPIVRRVFGGLIANDLVSVQPMSLPSGLIFFLDFTTSDPSTGKAGFWNGDSIYGGGVVGSQLTGGVNLTGTFAETGPYALNNGYASATGSSIVYPVANCIVAWGTLEADEDPTGAQLQPDMATLKRYVQYDPDFTSGSLVAVVQITGSTDINQFDVQDLITLTMPASADWTQMRRLTQLTTGSTNPGNPENAGWKVTMVLQSTASVNTDTAGGVATIMRAAIATTNTTLTHNITDNFVAGGALGSVVGKAVWELESNSAIPEIDIKVDSVAVTAMTKKLKAKWTPELGQDLNAYHNLDAEVELTGILSEQIALEIDQEILEDLIKGAKAGTYYWSRSPGLFVKKTTGKEVGASSAAPDFTGTVSEWYETLLETVNDVSAQIHRKTLRGGANFLVTSPEVANIMEFTAGFRATVTADDKKGQAGAVQVGTLNNKWDVHVDPYFPRNLVLVGRRGSGFLESGYVYAPYVPLQVTPTIFGTEDFVPRKGVMTRYAKKMVRPDMYGLVVVQGLLGGQAGATS